MSDYDHRRPTRFTQADCEAAVGRRATLTITGIIAEAQVGDVGPFVFFKPDERWGFDQRLGLDLDALKLDE